MDTSNYLSITDILVTNEKIPCKFMHDLPKMGFLDPSAADDDLKAGTNAEIPLWLAESLYTRRPPVVNVELPKIYKDSYREILNADACAVDMQKLGQYFYELGCYVARHDIKGEVASTLVNIGEDTATEHKVIFPIQSKPRLMTFRQRFRMLLSACVATDSISAMQPLSASERLQAAAAAQTELNLAMWLQRGDCPLTTADMVANHRKRKRAEMEML